MYGGYTGNRFEQDFHYTQDRKVDSKLWHRAEKNKLAIKFVYMGYLKYIDEAGFNLYVLKEDKYKAEIEAIGHDEIYDDCVFEETPKDQTKMMITTRGLRGNQDRRGYSKLRHHADKTKIGCRQVCERGFQYR